MDEYELGEFKIPKRIQKKLNDKEWLKAELDKGKTAQEILGFKDRTMAKFYKAASHLFEKECYTDAANAFLFLVTLNPKIADYWLGLGMSRQMCGMFDEAIDAYEMAAYYEMESPVPYFYLAKCLFAVHDRENAIKALDLALEYAEGKREFADIRKQAIRARELILSYE